jgi:hypothetical protein
MKVEALNPAPTTRRAFRLSEEKHVPERGGCYVLSTFAGDILYVGLSVNLRARMNQHLDNPEKCNETPLGRAVWFYWLECDHLEKVERTWLNAHELAEAALPILNGVHSPVSGV